MKKSLLALAALTAFAGVASAQSTVTLFGIIDMSLAQIKNSKSLKQERTDGINSSRIGFRGVEDLGGGLRAGFWLEGALATDTGTWGGGNGSGSVNFHRRSTASLLGGFGEIRLGRDYTPSFWNHTIFDPFGTNGLGSTTNILAAGANAIGGDLRGVPGVFGAPVNTFVRANNTVGYFLPAMGGVYGQLMVAAGEASTTVANKYFGGRIGFAGGPVNVAVGYGKTSNDNISPALMPDTLTDVNVGGSFAFGAATLMAQFGKLKMAKESQKTAMIGGTFDIGAGQIKASFTKNSGDTASAVLTKQYDARQIAVGYQYNLSKRTALYGTYSVLDNGGTAANGAIFSLSGSPATPALVRGESSKGVEVGLRHSF